MSTEDRVLKLENAFATLVGLVRNMDERMDESNSRIAVIESNLGALSQIVLELAQSQKRSDERLDKVTERLDKLTERVDRLADTVEKFINESRSDKS
ncbi:MAG TPA: hypothetical protein VGC66_25250 [Pyrinomonadaceae bacterium]|jgi:uncharacterized coiled-coil protein SlyX